MKKAKEGKLSDTSKQDSEDDFTPLTTNKNIYNQVSDQNNALFHMGVCLVSLVYLRPTNMYPVSRQFNIMFSRHPGEQSGSLLEPCVHITCSGTRPCIQRILQKC
jgi:hypothetical protein